MKSTQHIVSLVAFETNRCEHYGDLQSRFLEQQSRDETGEHGSKRTQSNTENGRTIKTVLSLWWGLFWMVPPGIVIGICAVWYGGWTALAIIDLIVPLLYFTVCYKKSPKDMRGGLLSANLRVVYGNSEGRKRLTIGIYIILLAADGVLFGVTVPYYLEWFPALLMLLNHLRFLMLLAYYFYTGPSHLAVRSAERDKRAKLKKTIKSMKSALREDIAERIRKDAFSLVSAEITTSSPNDTENIIGLIQKMRPEIIQKFLQFEHKFALRQDLDMARKIHKMLPQACRRLTAKQIQELEVQFSNALEQVQDELAMAYDAYWNEENVEERRLILLSIQNTRATHSETFTKLMKPLYLGSCDELLRVMVNECIRGLDIKLKDTYTIQKMSSDDADMATYKSAKDKTSWIEYLSREDVPRDTIQDIIRTMMDDELDLLLRQRYDECKLQQDALLNLLSAIKESGVQTITYRNFEYRGAHKFFFEELDSKHWRQLKTIMKGISSFVVHEGNTSKEDEAQGRFSWYIAGLLGRWRRKKSSQVLSEIALEGEVSKNQASAVHAFQANVQALKLKRKLNDRTSKTGNEDDELQSIMMIGDIDRVRVSALQTMEKEKQMIKLTS